MSDQNEKNLNQPEDGQDDFSSMSIDELIASTKEEIARIDQMMGTSRLPQQEDAQEPAPQQGAPQAGEVSLDDETDDKAKPSQSEPFEPKLPEEYADLSLDSDEQPEQDEQPQRAHLAAGVKVLLYVCCVLAASVLLAVFGWRLADDVLALTKPELFAAAAPCSGILFMAGQEDCLGESEIKNRKMTDIPVWMLGGEREPWLLDAVPTPDNRTGQSIYTWWDMNRMPGGKPADFDHSTVHAQRRHDWTWAGPDTHITLPKKRT